MNAGADAEREEDEGGGTLGLSPPVCPVPTEAGGVPASALLQKKQGSIMSHIPKSLEERPSSSSSSSYKQSQFA